MRKQVRNPELYLDAACDRALRDVEANAEGNRNNTLYKAACAVLGVAQGLRNEGVPVESDEVLVQRLQESSGLSSMEARTTIQSALRSAKPTDLEVLDTEYRSSPRPRRPAPSMETTATSQKRTAPADEVRRAWENARPISDVECVRGWFERRWPSTGAAMADTAESLDLCRALQPGESSATSWMRISETKPWSQGWNAVFPTYDDQGEMVGLRARWVREQPPQAKALSGKGVRAGKALEADPIGLSILRGVPLDTWSGEILICEGEPDYLALCTDPQRWSGGRAPAVFGIWSGAWTAAHGHRMHGATRIILATDNNRAGDEYAKKITDDLRHLGCPIGRWRIDQ